jgi:hypothetical protein
MLPYDIYINFHNPSLLTTFREILKNIHAVNNFWLVSKDEPPDVMLQ